jgi:hypothetical protein
MRIDFSTSIMFSAECGILLLCNPCLVDIWFASRTLEQELGLQLPVKPSVCLGRLVEPDKLLDDEARPHKPALDQLKQNRRKTQDVHGVALDVPPFVLVP